MKLPQRLIFYTLMLAGGLVAQPHKHHVKAGKALVEQVDGSTLQITTSQAAIINWETFSIAAKETVRFVQPDHHSAVLNRVVGHSPSEILGRLEANGKVILINPQGIHIGKEGWIKTGGFIASTLDLSDDEFMQQQDFHFQGDSEAHIHNYGKIEIDQGDAVLIGYRIVDRGSISASDVILGAGQDLVLRSAGDEKLIIQPSLNSQKNGTGIDQSSQIDAVRAELKADGNLYALAINQEGTINARGLVAKEGQIFLVSEKGTAQVNGQMTASSGKVHVLADNILLKEQTKIDVSGDFGGGEVLIGGDYQGQNPLIANASITQVENGAQINARANVSGDAGKVIVWANEGTAFKGFIDIQGGREAGDGGLAEVSGKNELIYRGLVNGQSAFGKVGQLLLDPNSVIIDGAATTGTLSACSPNSTYTPTGVSPSHLNAGDLSGQLVLCGVTVNTSPGSGGLGDITVNSSFTGTNPLTLNADHDIFINADIHFNSSLNLNSTRNFTISGHSLVAVGAALNLNVGGDLNVTSPTGSAVNISASTGGNLNITVNGNMSVNAQSMAFVTTTKIGGSGHTQIQINGNYSSTVDTNSPLILGSGSPTTFNVGGSASITTLNATTADFELTGSSLNSTIQNDFTMNAQATGGNTSASSITASGGDLNFSVGGNFTYNGQSGTNLSISGTNTNFVTGGDLSISTQNTAGSSTSVSGSGAVTVQAGGNMSLIGSPAATGPNQGIEFSSSGGVLSVFSGNSMTLAQGTFFSSASNLTVVIDTKNPAPPQIGNASLSIDGTCALSSSGSPLRIFTSRRFLNNIDPPQTTFNGVPFIPGPSGFDSPTEQWSTYYPSNFGGAPYTFFYKESGFSFPPISIDIFGKTTFNRAMSELFAKWTNFPLNFIANVLLNPAQPPPSTQPQSHPMPGVFPITYCMIFNPLMKQEGQWIIKYPAKVR